MKQPNDYRHHRPKITYHSMWSQISCRKLKSFHLTYIAGFCLSNKAIPCWIFISSQTQTLRENMIRYFDWKQVFWIKFSWKTFLKPSLSSQWSLVRSFIRDLVYINFVWLTSLWEQSHTKLMQKKFCTKLRMRLHWLERLGLGLMVRWNLCNSKNMSALQNTKEKD